MRLKLLKNNVRYALEQGNSVRITALMDGQEQLLIGKPIKLKNDTLLFGVQTFANSELGKYETDLHANDILSWS